MNQDASVIGQRCTVKFSEPDALNYTPFLVDFTTIAPELEFSIHTVGAR